jgi:hypothetical protein
LPCVQFSEAVNSTELSVTLVHSRVNGPAVTLSPDPQDTLAPPTFSEARPLSLPTNASVVPRMSAFAPSPLSFTEQELAEQETLSDVKVQALTVAREMPPASSAAVVRAARTRGIEDMAAA